jgi:hypothetical protein
MTRTTDYESLARWAETDEAAEDIANAADQDINGGHSRLADEIIRKEGRPRLDGDRGATGRAPRRQVRLPAELNTALDTYASQNHTTASEVIRQALHRYLDDAAA